jgi:DNA invertase Pin-like site-specific DNA recombinase
MSDKKNVVVWARVSTEEQKTGYSIDAQMRGIREKAQRDGLQIVREFMVAESAKKGADRKHFKEMLDWIKANAKRQNIQGLLAHKVDRVCRNMKDSVASRQCETLATVAWRNSPSWLHSRVSLAGPAQSSWRRGATFCYSHSIGEF